MLYDLNIPWSPQTKTDELDRTLRFSASLGYDVVALNHIIGGAIPPQVTNPLPKYDNTETRKLLLSSSIQRPKMPAVLHRATVVLSEPSQHHRLPQLAATYDLLAARPVTEDAFNAACLSLNDVSIISLDMSARQPFVLRNKTCMVAVTRGVSFEICYSHAFQGPAPPQYLGPTKGSKDNNNKSSNTNNSSGGGSGGDSGAGPALVDARARSAFIGNVVALVRATGGRGIILSSEARSVLGVRAPADIVNLFSVWGLRTDRATEGLGILPRGIVANETMKRSGFRGVVKVVKTAQREPETEPKARTDTATASAGQADDVVMEDAMDVNNDDHTSTATTTTSGDNISREAKQQNNSNAQKRKSDGDESLGGNEPSGQPMSKRQAKKLRAAARSQ